MNLSLNFKNRLTRITLLMSIMLTGITGVRGQLPDTIYQERIFGLFESVVSSRGDEARNLFADSLVAIVEEYLEDDFPVEHKLEGIRYLGQILSPDSLFKLVSWNIAFLDGTNRYTCFIARKEGGGTVISYLDGRRGLAGVNTDSIIYRSDWYGALYYSIIPFISAGRKYYAVLGLDLNGMFTNSKVIEILSFDEKGGVHFGAPLIYSGNRLQVRMIFRYSAEVSMMLRYDEVGKRIVFDHLSPAEPSFTGVYQYYGPDFSYDSLELRDGKWWLVEDVDLRNIER